MYYGNYDNDGKYLGEVGGYDLMIKKQRQELDIHIDI